MCTECIQAASSATASPPSPSLSMEAASLPSLRRASSGCEAVNWSTSSARNSRGCPGTLGSGGCGELCQTAELRLTLTRVVTSFVSVLTMCLNWREERCITLAPAVATSSTTAHSDMETLIRLSTHVTLCDS